MTMDPTHPSFGAPRPLDRIPMRFTLDLIVSPQSDKGPMPEPGDIAAGITAILKDSFSMSVGVGGGFVQSLRLLPAIASEAPRRHAPSERAIVVSAPVGAKAIHVDMPHRQSDAVEIALVNDDMIDTGILMDPDTAEALAHAILFQVARRRANPL
jgi:hypothetical protein